MIGIHPRALAAIALLVLAAPAAQASVAVEDVRVPDRTLAGKPFEVSLTLANDGEAREVYLFAALYAEDPAASDCGSATDPRFRTFTHLVQERVRVPAGARLDYPPEGSRWLHRYDARHVDAAPSDAEFCVFVANASQGPLIDYEDYATTPLSVRGRNSAPAVSFSVTPARAVVAEEARFEANGRDAEGDPIHYAWDFGHHVASGRARAEGPSPRHAFYPEGSYVVTLTATDGLNETVVTRTVEVGPPGRPPEARELLPAPALGAALAAALVALGIRRR